MVLAREHGCERSMYHIQLVLFVCLYPFETMCFGCCCWEMGNRKYKNATSSLLVCIGAQINAQPMNDDNFRVALIIVTQKQFT